MELRYTFGALCKLEKITGKSVSVALSSLAENPSMGTIRDIYMAGRHFQKPEMTAKEAEDEIDSILTEEGMEGLVNLIQKAIDDSSVTFKKKKN